MFTPRASWVYRGIALLITIILIAACAAFMPANGLFSFKNGLFLMLVACTCPWLLRDAWKAPQGSLHYAQGQWYWLHDNQETPGTLRLHFDLQTYMLVSFSAHSVPYKLFPITTQWFHLEARHLDHAASPAQAGAWAALRRAIYSSMESADETLAA
jgi:hypothetical protein